MNPETFPKNPFNLSPKAIGVGLGWLAGYAMLAAALGVLLYKFTLVPVFVVPVLAEGVLVKSIWTTCSFWWGLLARSMALTVSHILEHNLYVIPVIYEGGQPWPEEYAWAGLVLAGQTVVAAVVLLVVRKLLRSRHDKIPSH